MPSPIRYTLLSTLASTMNSSNNPRRPLSFSRLLSCWPRLISPVSWWHCFNLLYSSSFSAKDPPTNTGRDSRRLTWKTFKFVILHIFLLIFVGLWCYIYYSITFDAGQYLRLLSSLSSNKTGIEDGREKFDQMVWRTALRTFFISVNFGLINACGVALASLWRQRLCKRFYNLIFRSPNGCILYDTAQNAIYDLPTQLTNDIRQFTSHLSIALFGSLFFSGFLAVSTVIVVFSVYIVQQTSGDTNGIVICYGTFGFSVLFVSLISYRFNRAAVEQLKSKGKIRSFLQRLQTNAECIAFYASSRQCELVAYMKLNTIVHRWNVLGGVFYALVNFPLIFMDAIGGFINYILPALLFFFLRKAPDQTPDEANKYLGIIAFYGYIFWLLSSLIYISESCLIAVTLADRLYTLKQRLLALQSFHTNRLRHDLTAQTRIESPDLLQIVKMSIIVPDDYEQRVLQSNINLNAKRGECVLVSGATGCGKTSLFRICAGLWPIDADVIRLPARKQTIYIPQRPYLPIGSLRFQALFLLDTRYGTVYAANISDYQIRELFQLVNMDYLLDRYDLDTIVEWSSSLSIGEQQRLAFIRLFALYKYIPDQANDTLVMFDESTSAIDATTETIIYQLLNELRIWFVTISHRPSLIKYHKKELRLYSKVANTRENELNLNHSIEVKIDIPVTTDTASIEEDQSDVEAKQVTTSALGTNIADLIEIKRSNNWFKDIRDVWRVIHLPFGASDKKLRNQTYFGWFAYFLLLSGYTYLSYRLTVQTGAIFRVLPDYAASNITIDEGRTRVRQLAWSYILIIVSVTTIYSVLLSIGQVLGALYTRRQSTFVARLLLDDDENQYTLYHSSALKLLPNIISHDLAELNTQLFYLLVGSIYFNGMLGTIVKSIVYTILLTQQSGSGKGVLVVYLYQLFISILITCAIRPYYRANMKFENIFALFTNAQKRVDLQAEQIALSDRGVVDIEHSHLCTKLDESTRAQRHSGYFYGLLVACSVLGNWSGTIINYAIPSAIFFHFTPNPTVMQAASIVTLTVYTGYLQGSLATFNSHGQPFSQVWTIGRRIAQNLEQLIALRRLHRDNRAIELSSGRRVEINTFDTFQQKPLLLKNVDVCIPSMQSAVLIRSLSFVLDSQSSLIITGSSGCGKSSLLRLLAGLQYNITENSLIQVPSRFSAIYLPQQLHLIEGTLREQLNYFRQAKNLSVCTNDHLLRQLLFQFNLAHLIERYSFDSSVQLWSRTLSLGEQQRLIIAVALVALMKSTDGVENNNEEVKYLILDETTAGCDELTQKTIYEYLQNSNIQYISISHRSQLVKYHTHQLVINSKNQSYEIIQHM